MKKLFALFTFLFVITPVISLSAPNYDPNNVTTVYDNSYNIELRNRLEREYYEKCHIQITPTLGENICGTNSYAEMVAQKYIDLQKNDDELPHYQIKTTKLHGQH